MAGPVDIRFCCKDMKDTREGVRVEVVCRYCSDDSGGANDPMMSRGERGQCIDGKLDP